LCLTLKLISYSIPLGCMQKSISDIVEEVKSGVIHIVHTVDGQRKASGTGFMVNGRLVTNYHVIYPAPDNSVVVLRTYDSNPQDLLDGIKLPYAVFLESSVTASDERGYDYIVFNLPQLKEKELYNFSWGDPKSKRMGDSILFLGYPFEGLNLVCHTGIISSLYKNHRDIDIVQIDASVNVSNSGGPLIDPKTSEVIGIITRKHTGLTQKFNELRLILEKNIKTLVRQERYPSSLKDFFFLKGLIANQEHILKLTGEIERSANVGIGYAFSIEHLNRENISNPEE